MAGGEGTRLRPLTSNQPKPMVPIVGKPCMEHVIDLLRLHGFDDIVVTLAFMPQSIRSYFGDGSAHGVGIRYSVEETPAGTAGSVKLAEEALDEPFLVISGDALCDIDLGALVRHHQERKSLVTIALKSVDNPLEFGIVVTDEDGRIERFLEKPTWAQVFTDTINTGIYVIEPEVLRHIPEGTPYDFSKELFPLLLEKGRPLHGNVVDGYWKDIGNLEQYREANFDALDERVRLEIPGIRLRGNVWVGEGVELDNVESVEGPAFVGNYCRLDPLASIGAYSVLAQSVALREHARVARSIVDASTYIGSSAIVEGAVVGRGCDIRAHARIGENAAIGDQTTIGEEAVIAPGVRIYPFKEIEAGTHVDRNVIWEAQTSSSIFGRERIRGLVNVDLTPETALRLGIALGTALKRGARVVTSRESPTACRLVRRAIVVGINASGVHVSDLRVMPAAVNRHLLKIESFEAGLHVGPSSTDPEAVEVQIYEPPGVQASSALVKEIEKHFSRQEFRRAASEEVGEIRFPSHSGEDYARDLLTTLDAPSIQARRLKVVVDYGYSSASLVLPLVLGPLEVEAISARAYLRERRPAVIDTGVAESVGYAKRLVSAVGADVGAVLDPSAERLYLVDEQANEIPAEQALLLFLRLLAASGRTGRVAVPVTVTSLVDTIVEGTGLEIERTAASLAALTRGAARDGVVFAGSANGGFLFPDFLPAYDGVASLCKLLELLAPLDQPLSAIVAGLPVPAVRHRAIRCPWARKGTVMRILSEKLKDERTDTLDGLKVFTEQGWAQVLPDPAEPLVHIYAEGAADEDSQRLEEEYVALVEAAISGAAESGEAQNPQVKVEG